MTVEGIGLYIKKRKRDIGAVIGGSFKICENIAPYKAGFDGAWECLQENTKQAKKGC